MLRNTVLVAIIWIICQPFLISRKQKNKIIKETSTEIILSTHVYFIYTGLQQLGIMNFNQIWHDNDFSIFTVNVREDSFGHRLSQIWHLYLEQQLSWAVLSMTTA